eukprot:1161265-Pelagomonas_calceolata.AAC.10
MLPLSPKAALLHLEACWPLLLARAAALHCFNRDAAAAAALQQQQQQQQQQQSPQPQSQQKGYLHHYQQQQQHQQQQQGGQQPQQQQQGQQGGGDTFTPEELELAAINSANLSVEELDELQVGCTPA